MGHAANCIEGYQLPTFAVLAVRLLESRRGFRSLNSEAMQALNLSFRRQKPSSKHNESPIFSKKRDEAGLTYLAKYIIYVHNSMSMYTYIYTYIHMYITYACTYIYIHTYMYKSSVVMTWLNRYCCGQWSHLNP